MKLQIEIYTKIPYEKWPETAVKTTKPNVPLYIKNISTCDKQIAPALSASNINSAF